MPCDEFVAGAAGQQSRLALEQASSTPRALRRVAAPSPGRWSSRRARAGRRMRSRPVALVRHSLQQIVASLSIRRGGDRPAEPARRRRRSTCAMSKIETDRPPTSCVVHVSVDAVVDVRPLGMVVALLGACSGHLCHESRWPGEVGEAILARDRAAPAPVVLPRRASCRASVATSCDRASVIVRPPPTQAARCRRHSPKPMRRTPSRSQYARAGSRVAVLEEAAPFAVRQRQRLAGRRGSARASSRLGPPAARTACPMPNRSPLRRLQPLTV